MTIRQNPSPLTEADISSQLADMAARCGVPVPGLRLTRHSSEGRYEAGRHTIVLGRGLLVRPGYARATLAHEFGHHVVTQAHPPSRFLVARRLAMVLPPTLACIFFLCVTMTSPPWARAGGPSWLMTGLWELGIIGSGALILIATHRMGTQVADEERAADLIGADLGFPYTAADLTQAQLKDNRRVRFWAWADGAHPTWERRLEVIAIHLAGQVDGQKAMPCRG